ncbi:MAG: sigma-70 family RNA polymerase sigma factor [Planctomycetota bacterium]
MAEPSNRPDPSVQLLLRWQEQADPEALDELLRLEMTALKRRLRGKGREMVASPASLSDVAQDAVLKILQADDLPRFDDPKVFSAYLWRAAWRLLLDRLRRGHQEMVSLDAGSSDRLADQVGQSGGQSEVDRRDAGQRIAFILSLMSPEDRQVLELRFRQELSLGQIGEQLGLDPDAARMRLVRAKRRMARKLNGWEELLS